MKLLAVDSNSIMNRAFYGIKVLTTKDGFFTNAVYGFLSILLSAVSEVKPDGIRRRRSLSRSSRSSKNC